MTMMCELTDILMEYYERMGLDPEDGSNAILVRHTLIDPGVVFVRIRLDGYEVRFLHRETYEIPPHTCWQPQGSWLNQPELVLW